MRKFEVKYCACCPRVFDQRGWESLPPIGDMVLGEGERPYALQMRNCSCGSTLAVAVDERGRYDFSGVVS